MARRKSAAKRENEFIDGILKLSSLGVFFIVLYITRSFSISLVMGITGLICSFIFLFIRNANYNKKIKASGITDIDKMSGTKFEYFLKLFFKQQGYGVQETKVTGDYGADLILRKDARKIIVQAKRYKNRVGLKAVQETVSAIAYYGASEGWVVTNSEFTGSAIELAKANNIRLIERNELIQLMLQLNSDQHNDLAKKTQAKDLKERCKRCGSELVLQNSRRGQFYGCSKFPKCKYAKKVI